MTYRVNRPAVASVILTVAAGLAVGGCASSAKSSTASCSAHHAVPGQAGGTPSGSPNPAAAAGWTLPGGNLANTRDVASAITSSNVSTLGVAWCVPVEFERVPAMPLAWPIVTRRPRSWCMAWCTPRISSRT